MLMSDPSFWDDPDKARSISQEATALKTEVEGHEALVQKAVDLSDYLEMAMEDGDTSLAGDIETQYDGVLKEIEKREVLLLLSDEYDRCNAIVTFHAGAAVRRRRIGRRCWCACIRAGPNKTVTI